MSRIRAHGRSNRRDDPRLEDIGAKIPNKPKRKPKPAKTAGQSRRKKFTPEPEWRLPWSTLAVFSVVMEKLICLRAAGMKEYDAPGWDGVELMGGEDRFSFSISKLQERCGLGKSAIIRAKQHLCRLKLCHWQEGLGRPAVDTLYPNQDLQVTVRSTKEGHSLTSFGVVSWG